MTRKIILDCDPGHDDAVAIPDQVALADELVTSGRTAAIGLSNYSPARLREFFRDRIVLRGRAAVGAAAALQPRPPG